MSDIAVYIEGGGSTAEQKAELRRGLDSLFTREKSIAREQRGSLRLICCGGRQEAHDAFIDALDKHPERMNALLVDSESPVAPAPTDRKKDAIVRLEHLRKTRATGERGQGDGWPLIGVSPERIHLMVQCMEAWIVADPEALADFYEQDFKIDSLPKRINLEEEPKAGLYSKLESATERTQKGKYGKIKHASKLLLAIDPEKVAKRCPRFSILRDWLVESIEA